LKIGDILVSKKELQGFTIGKKYTIVISNINYISFYDNNGLLSSVDTIRYKEYGHYVYDYFITLKEIRKLKLEEIENRRYDYCC